VSELTEWIDEQIQEFTLALNQSAHDYSRGRCEGSIAMLQHFRNLEPLIDCGEPDTSDTSVRDDRIRTAVIEVWNHEAGPDLPQDVYDLAVTLVDSLFLEEK
jgi:hypothetical protein